MGGTWPEIETDTLSILQNSHNNQLQVREVPNKSQTKLATCRWLSARKQ